MNRVVDELFKEDDAFFRRGFLSSVGTAVMLSAGSGHESRKVKFNGHELHEFRTDYTPVRPYENVEDHEFHDKIVGSDHKAPILVDSDMANIVEHDAYTKEYFFCSKDQRYCAVVLGKPYVTLTVDELKTDYNLESRKMINFSHATVLFRNLNYNKKEEPAMWEVVNAADFIESDRLKELPNFMKKSVDSKATKYGKMEVMINGFGQKSIMNAVLDSTCLDRMATCIKQLELGNMNRIKGKKNKDGIRESPVIDDKKNMLQVFGAENIPKIEDYRDAIHTTVVQRAVRALAKDLVTLSGTLVTLTPEDLGTNKLIHKKKDADGNIKEYNPTVLDWDQLRGVDSARATMKDLMHSATDKDDVLLNSQISEVMLGTKGPAFERVILFDGPAGTGKTFSAKIMAQQGNLPFVHIGQGVLVSKWLGESEKNVAKLFGHVAKIGKIKGNKNTGPQCILFMDEIDSMVSSNLRASSSSGALTTFLERLSGFSGDDNTFMFVCCTNVKNKLDPAFLNRVDISITFPAPDLESRAAILDLYCKHLKVEDIRKLAKLCEIVDESGNVFPFTGRDIMNIHEKAVENKVKDILHKFPDAIRDNVDGIFDTKDEFGPDFEHYQRAIEEKKRNVRLRKGTALSELHQKKKNIHI